MPVTVVRAPSDGRDSTSAPFAPNTATRGLSLINMLPGRPGKIVPRGSVFDTLALANTGVGAYFFDNLLVQLATGNFQIVQLNGATAPALSGASFARPGLVQQVGANPGTPSISQAIVGDYCFIRANSGGIIRWDGSNVAGGFLNLANGPQGTTAVASHLSRVFAVGGTPPGGGITDANTLYWTDPGGPGADLLTGWQDDVSGLVNRIKLSLPAGDAAQAMVSFQRQLLIFGKRYIVAITGSTPSSFQQQIVASAGVFRSPGSLCVATEGVYFMSEDGLCLWDGVELRRLYGNIYTSLDATLSGWTIAEMTDQYLLLGHTTAGNAMYHIPSGSWSNFVGPKLYKGLAKTTNYRAGWTNVGIDGLDYVADPELSLAANKTIGFDHNGAFLAIAISKPVRLAEPMQQANIRRFAPRFELYDTAVGSPARWDVRLQDERASVDLATASFAPRASGSSYAQSGLTEVFAEIDKGLVVRWEFLPNGAVVDGVPEAHDCYVEWDTAQQ